MREPFDLAELRRQFLLGTPIYTAHAALRVVERRISGEEIVESILDGVVIEDYPEDKYGPSCLIMGRCASGRVLHVQVTYPPLIKIITAYSPSSTDWEEDWRTRR